jgi:predicted DNA-binding WGR domain protein
MGPIAWMLFHKIDPEENERRFYYSPRGTYGLEVGSSLVDEHAVLRVWGRIGGQQHSLATPCASAEAAQTLARPRLRGDDARRRLQRGYRVQAQQVDGDEQRISVGSRGEGIV